MIRIDPTMNPWAQASTISVFGSVGLVTWAIRRIKARLELLMGAIMITCAFDGYPDTGKENLQQSSTHQRGRSHFLSNIKGNSGYKN